MFRKSLLELILCNLIIWGCAVSLFGQTNNEKLIKANAIFAEAENLYNQGTAISYRSALEKYREASRLYEEINDKSENAGKSFQMSGVICDKLGEKTEALKYYEKALSFFQTNKFKKSEAATLNSIGILYSSLGDKQKALEYYNLALPLRKQVGDKAGEATTLNSIGVLYYSLGDKQKALEFYHRALPLRKEVGSKSGEATTLNGIGLVYYSLGELQKALEFYHRALPLRKEVGDKAGEATTLTNMGLVYSLLGEKQKALEFYSQALPLSKEVGDKKGEAITLANIGSAYSALGEKQKALEYYNLALPLNKEIGDKASEATTLGNLGSLYSSLGENQKAMEFYNRALSLQKEVGDKSGEAVMLNGIGSVYSLLGEKQKALEFYNRALPLRKEVGDKKGESVTLNSFGNLYSGLGENQKALEYYDLALSLQKKIGYKAGEAGTLTNIGLVYNSLGESPKALEFFNRALLLQKEVGDKSGEATTLNGIGLAHSSLDSQDEALEYYKQSLSLRKEVGDRAGESVTLTNISYVYHLLGKNQYAQDYCYQALPLQKKVGDKTGEAATLGTLMFIWNNLDNSQLAVFYGKQAINLYQELRTKIQGLDKEIQKTYLRSIESTYRQLAEILIKQNRLAEAQQVLELLKDQQFFDFNRNLNEPIKQLVQTPRETKSTTQYAKSSEKIGGINQQTEELKRKIGIRQPTSSESAQLQKLENDLKITTDEFLALLNQFRIDFFKPDKLDKVGDVSNHHEMKTALGKLTQQIGQKTVAVYTLVGEEKYHALIVSSDGIKAVSSSIKGPELDDKAIKLWGLLQSDRYDTTVLSKQIYDVVFKTIEAELPKDTTTIMWSLDGNLRYIPMAALWDGKQFLAERFNHVVFTRADLERMTRNLNPNWTGTGLGTTQSQTVELLGDKISFSALPGVNEEFKEIFKQSGSKTGILTGEVFSDSKFNKINLISSLKQRRPVVHIASHFSFRPGDEARSFLLMGDGTAFSLNEMKKETNLFQGVDLLALSACNTAATQTDANGREIDGFAELAQRLGAGAVMATLWSVSDASTPWLMRDFYSNKLSIQGMTKAEALRKAQLALLKGTAQTKPLPQNEKGTAENKVQIVIIPKGGSRSGNTIRSDVIYLDEEEAPLYKKEGKGKFAHPYFWSPFILIGNWR